MAELGELSLAHQLFLHAYPWRRIDPIPWALPRKPLAESRLALVSSAGLSLPGQAPFDLSLRGGDWSLREIPSDADLGTLVESHRSDAFDHSGLAADRNLGFPLDRLRGFVANGSLGSLAPSHVSFMGSLTAVGRFVNESLPRIVRQLSSQEVDVALLVPV